MTEDQAARALRGDDPAAAARAEAALWQMWGTSGVPEIDRLFARGVEAMERRDLLAAEAMFTDVIRRAPDFAEGWNKRATVRYLDGNHAAAIADCEETVARKPTTSARSRARGSVTWRSGSIARPPISSGAPSPSIPTSRPPVTTWPPPLARSSRPTATRDITTSRVE